MIMEDRHPNTPTRRDILKKAAYVAPVVLTFRASPAFAQRGSFAPVRQGPPAGVPVLPPHVAGPAGPPGPPWR